MLLQKTNGPQTRFYIAYCKYCKRPFIKTHNRVMYCSDECRGYALKEKSYISTKEKITN